MNMFFELCLLADDDWRVAIDKKLETVVATTRCMLYNYMCFCSVDLVQGFSIADKS